MNRKTKFYVQKMLNYCSHLLRGGSLQSRKIKAFVHTMKLYWALYGGEWPTKGSGRIVSGGKNLIAH